MVTLSKQPGKLVELTDEEITLLDFCKTMGRIDLQDAMEILELPKRTAQRRLKTLVEKKLIVIKGKSKNIYYVLK